MTLKIQTAAIEMVNKFEVTTLDLPNGAKVMELRFHTLAKPNDPTFSTTPRLRLKLEQAQALHEAMSHGLCVMRGEATPNDALPRH